MLLQPALPSESYCSGHRVVVGFFLFFPPLFHVTEVLTPSCRQSATGDRLAAPEALSDSVEGDDAANRVEAAARGKKKKKKIKLLFSLPLVLRSVGISEQRGIHENQLKIYSRNQARGIPQHADIKLSYHKAKKKC